MRLLGIVKIQRYGKNNFRATLPVELIQKLDLKFTDKLVFCENKDGEVILRRNQRI